MKILIDKGYRNYGLQKGPINEGSVLFQKKINDDLFFNINEWNWSKYDKDRGKTYEFDINLDGIDIAEGMVLQCTFYSITEEKMTGELIDALESRAMFLYNVFLKGQYALEVAVMSEAK